MANLFGSATSQRPVFCFAIVERKLEGALGAESSIVDFNLRRQARALAKIQARERDLID
jgi:hypothetical protein